MRERNELDRFIRAQEADYKRALEELKKGKKKTHWMWYIFPQLRGLGFSNASMYYGIQNTQEAKLYLKTSPLRDRLLEVCHVLLRLDEWNAVKIFGQVDSRKLQSSMTLFYSVAENAVMRLVFKEVLNKFFDGNLCKRTIEMLEREAQHA